MKDENIKIAIIGGGFSGSSTAYFLREQLPENVTIKVFEMAERSGGRACMRTVDGNEVEMGASIYHSKNKYIMDFVKQFKLKRLNLEKKKSDLIIYDGNGQSAMSTVGTLSIFKPFKMIGRYKCDLFKVTKYTKKVVKEFSRVYEIQAAGRGFTTTEGMLRAISRDGEHLLRMCEHSYDHWLTNEVEVGQRLRHELAHALTANNYTQTLSIHALPGLVSMCTTLPHLECVEDGNYKVTECLLQHALGKNAEEADRSPIKAQVRLIRQNALDNKYILDYEDENGNKSTSETFDYVVIATPLHQNCHLEVESPLILPKYEYREMSSTVIAGEPKSEFFGLKKGTINSSTAVLVSKSGWDSETEKRILSVVPKNFKQKKATLYSQYTIFSEREFYPDPINDLPKELFEPNSVTDATTVNWLAYPVYKPVKNYDDELGKFLIAPGLYYANAFELAVSCMETAIVGGANVANLISADFQNKHGIQLKSSFTVDE